MIASTSRSAPAHSLARSISSGTNWVSAGIASCGCASSISRSRVVPERPTPTTNGAGAGSAPAAASRLTQRPAPRLRGERLEQLQPVGRAGQRVDRVLGMRHQPDDVAAPRCGPRRRRRPSRSGSARPRSGRRSARRPRARASRSAGANQRPLMCLTGIESAVAGLAGGGRDRVGARRPRARPGGRRSAGPRSASSAPGSSPASQSTWKPLQIPSTGPPAAANSAHRLHHRSEAGDRAGAQVVAVGEAAGDDDRVDPGEVRVAVPDQPRLADPLAGEHRVALIARPGELQHAEHQPSIDPDTPGREAEEVSGMSIS